MKRVLKIGLVGMLTLMVLVLGAVAVMINNETFLAGLIESRVSAALDRKLSIGELDVSTGLQTTVRLQNIRIANAEWGTAAELLSLGQVDAVLDFSNYFQSGVEILDLEVINARLNLEENEAGGANWILTADESNAEESGGKSTVRWRNIRLTQFELTHSAPQREVPLDFNVGKFEASQSPGGRVDLAGAGVIGGYELDVEGMVEPLAALLGGGRISHRLTVTLGENRLRSEGEVANIHSGAGARIDMHFAGPNFEWLLQQAALPGFSEGTFDASLRIEVSDDEAMEFEFDGDLGSLQASATGTVDRLLEPSRLDLEFMVSGPDIEALGETFSVQDLPSAPYAITGKTRYENQALEIGAFDGRIGQDQFSVKGYVGPWPELAGTALDVRANGPDASVWAPVLSVAEMKAAPFGLSGRINESDQELIVEDMRLSLGANVLGLDGSLGRLPEFLNADMRVTLEAPDMGALPGLSRIKNIPDVSAHLSADLSRTPEGVHLAALLIEADGNQLAADGFVAWPPGLTANGLTDFIHQASGSWLMGRLDLPSGQEFVGLFGSGSLPNEAMALMIDLRLEEGVLEFEFEDGDLGDVDLSLKGSVPAMPDLEGAQMEFSARFALSGPDFRQFLNRDELAGLPGRFEITGELATEGDHEQVNSLVVRLGDTTIEASGSILNVTGQPDGQFRARLSIPDIREFQPYFGRFTEISPPSMPLSLEFTLQASPAAWVFNDISANAGASDLRGRFEYRPGDVPVIAAGLQSKTIDLSWLSDPQQAAQAQAPAGPRNTKSKTGSYAGPNWLFNEDPLPVLSMDPVEINASLKVDTLDLPMTTLGDFNVGLTLSGQSLKFDPVEFTGVEGGKLTGSLSARLDSNSITLKVNGVADDFKLGLAAGPDQDLSNYPPLDILADIEAKGGSMRELASSSNGRIGLIFSEGRILNSRVELLFTDILSQLFSTLNPFAKKSEYTDLECAVARVSLKDGVAEIDPAILQTREITATSSGRIDLNTETIDMSFNTKPRKGIGVSPGMVINPFIRLGGTLARPAMTLDASGAAVSGGAAVATAGLSLLGKSLYDRFLSERDPCGRVSTELRKMHQDDAQNP